MVLDDYLESLGGMCLYQVLVIILINLNSAPSYFLLVSGSILSATPDYRCKVQFGEDISTWSNMSNFPIPEDACLRYNYTFGWSNITSYTITNHSAQDTIPCDLGWVYSKEFYQKTTVSEWDLICTRRTLDSIANSLFFFGFMGGSLIFGVLSERIGRKLSLLAFCCVMNGSTILTSFITSFPLYVILRIITAAAATGVYLGNFTLCTELASKSSRIKVHICILNFNALQELAVPLLAFYQNDWSYFVFAIGLMCVPFLFMFVMIPDSPKWLLLKGRHEEAKRIISRILRSKNKKFNDIVWNQIIEIDHENVIRSGKSNLTYLDLFKLPFTRVITIITMYCWSVTSMVSYGLILNVTKLAGNPYVNSTLNGLFSFAGSLLIIFCGKIGRKRMLCYSLMIAGVSCLMSMIFKQYSNGDNILIYTSVAMAFLGKLSCNLAYCMIYIVTAEVYPTAARGLGMGIGSMAARFGSVIMPFTLQLQYNIPWLTQAIFGSFSLLGGMLAFLLPEMDGNHPLTIIDEAEKFYASNMKTTARFIRKSKKSSQEFPEDNKFCNETLL